MQGVIKGHALALISSRRDTGWFEKEVRESRGTRGDVEEIEEADKQRTQ